MSIGIKTLEAADNGITAITKTIESMQSTLRQARQDKSFQTKSYTIDATAIGTASAKNLSFSAARSARPLSTSALNTASAAATPGSSTVGHDPGASVHRRHADHQRHQRDTICQRL